MNVKIFFDKTILIMLLLSSINFRNLTIFMGGYPTPDPERDPLEWLAKLEQNFRDSIESGREIHFTLLLSQYRSILEELLDDERVQRDDDEKVQRDTVQAIQREVDTLLPRAAEVYFRRKMQMLKGLNTEYPSELDGQSKSALFTEFRDVGRDFQELPQGILQQDAIARMYQEWKDLKAAVSYKYAKMEIDMLTLFVRQAYPEYDSKTHSTYTGPKDFPEYTIINTLLRNARDAGADISPLESVMVQLRKEAEERWQKTIRELEMFLGTGEPFILDNLKMAERALKSVVATNGKPSKEEGLAKLEGLKPGILTIRIKKTLLLLELFLENPNEYKKRRLERPRGLLYALEYGILDLEEVGHDVVRYKERLKSIKPRVEAELKRLDREYERSLQEEEG